MSDESRIVKLETQMDHIQADVAEVKGDVKWLVREFSSFRTDLATHFGAVETRFEAMNTAMERNTRWLMGVGVGALASLLGMLGHALRWF